LIEKEAWAIAPPKHSPVGELTGRRASSAAVQVLDS
jgi:hypothetical protein